MMRNKENKTESTNYAINLPGQNADYEITKKKHQGKEHIVVPVVMMVEGVHNGSHGNLFHSASELGKFTGAWDGIPVVIDHPKKDGMSISANSPDIIDDRMVGRVYNSHMDGLKLKAEAWLDEEKLAIISPEALAHILGNNPLEVSVGVFTEEEDVEGDFINDNGDKEHYEKIASGHRPDHLALLPGGTGACSWKDGCGIRNNKENTMNIEKTLQQLSKDGFIIDKIQCNIEGSYQQLMDAAYGVMRGMEMDGVYCYIEAVYDGYLIYQKSIKGEDSPKIFKQAYSYADGKMELTGEPKEVVKKVEYVVNTHIIRNKVNVNNLKGGQKMSEVKCTPCVEKKVNDLIANSQGRWTEDDREELQNLSEATLDKLAKPVEVIKEVTKEVEALSAEDKAALAYGKRQLKDRREGLIRGIQENTSKEIWPDEKLVTMDDDTLERVSISVKKEEAADYSLNIGAVQSIHNGEKVEPMLPVGVELEKV